MTSFSSGMMSDNQHQPMTIQTNYVLSAPQIEDLTTPQEESNGKMEMVFSPNTVTMEQRKN